MLLGFAAALAWTGVALGPPLCAGDCNADGTVTVDEVLRGVNIAIALLPPGDCRPADGNDDGLVTIDEVVAAVAAGLSGCPQLPVPASATPTPTPSCANLAGRWISRERGAITCVSSRLDDEEVGEIDGEENIKIKQTGCEVRYTVPGVNLERTGTIDGAHVSFTGPFLRTEFDQSLRENLATLEGVILDESVELTSTGVASGTFDDGSAEFSCTGTSTVVLTPDD